MTAHTERVSPEAQGQDPKERARKQWRKARLEGLREGRPRVGPQTVHFDLANACNTRCTTCWDHSPWLRAERVPSAAWKRKTLGLERFRATLDELVALGGLEQVILSGMGEPFLNPALYDMVAHAHAHGLGVTIITNLLLADLGRLFSTQGELHLLTSICGVTQPVWHAFHAHPRPDGFEVLTRQLEGLKERGFKPKHVQVINNQNFHELVEMVHFARRYPAARINFKFASLAEGTEAVALSQAQKEQLLDDLIPRARAFAHAYKLPTDLDAFARQVDPGSHRTAPMEDVGCFMGYLYARITVEGELLYCCNAKLGVGHLDEGLPFAQAWEGARWQARRDSVRAGRYFEGCDQCGKFKQNLKWSQRLREKLPPDEFAALLGRDDLPPTFAAPTDEE
jgi:MoaA/NifB/PqqE/SkfB family radical SAM enzyme